MSDDPVIVYGGQVFFRHRELACPATGELRLHPGFATALGELRRLLDRPMIVTSCCRSAAHNAKVGGHPRSLHVWDKPNHGARGTLAIDVRRGDAAFNSALAKNALREGWSLGVGRDFFHLDRRDLVDLPQQVFGY